MLKDNNLANLHLNALWNIMDEEIEVFIAVHKEKSEGRIVLFIDALDEDTKVGEIRAFVSEGDVKSYLATLTNAGAYVRYTVGKLSRNMKVLQSKRPELNLNVVLYAVDINSHFYNIDTLWTYRSH